MKHKWKCPYCEESGTEDWNKSCYYKLINHIKKKHTNEVFDRIIANYKIKNKRQLIDNHWSFFAKNITTTHQSM